jgi:hypothetical protein
METKYIENKAVSKSSDPPTNDFETAALKNI